MEKTLITLIIASAGGLIGLKLKIPAGAMIGAMVAVSAYNIYSGNAYIPGQLKIAAQIILGGIIGLSINMEAVKGLKAVIVPGLILVAVLFVFSLISGLIIAKVTGMDLYTALFSCSPGGLTEMTIIADSYGADLSKVVLVHLIRILSVILFFPIVIVFFAK